MLEGLLHDKLPRLAEHLDAIKCDLKTLATDWFLCAFARSLPAETTCRVWDALYAEGGKVCVRARVYVRVCTFARVHARMRACVFVLACIR